MRYYHNLYVSENLVSKKIHILSQIEKERILVNKYLIVLSQNEKNHLEFFDSVMLIQKMIEKESLFVVGIADGYRGALKIVENITQEVYDKTNGTDIRMYILDKQREYEEMDR